MGYLQNGICYGSQAEAKNDFLSHVNDVSERVEALQQLNSMTASDMRAFFPDCRTASENYVLFQSALLGVVCLLLALGWIKRAVFI